VVAKVRLNKPFNKQLPMAQLRNRLSRLPHRPRLKRQLPMARHQNKHKLPLPPHKRPTIKLSRVEPHLKMP